MQELQRLRASTPVEPKNLGQGPVPGSQNSSLTSEIPQELPEDTGTHARRKLLESSIEDLLEQVSNCTSIEINDDMADTLLFECHTKKAPSLKGDIAQINKSIDHYLSQFRKYDMTLVDRVDVSLRKAREWVLRVGEKYNQNEVYRPPPSKENPVNLERFNPESEIDIFEFLSKFERKFRLLGSNQGKS